MQRQEIIQEDPLSLIVTEELKDGQTNKTNKTFTGHSSCLVYTGCTARRGRH